MNQIRQLLHCFNTAVPTCCVELVRVEVVLQYLWLIPGPDAVLDHLGLVGFVGALHLQQSLVRPLEAVEWSSWLDGWGRRKRTR